jgi:ribosomal protein S5
MDPWTIDTVGPLGAGVGDGDGDVGAGDGALGEEDPHAAESANNAAARTIR